VEQIDMPSDLPFGAELVPSPNKRHSETVIFVPHFGGTKRSVWRHVSLMNELGYDVVRFNLVFNEPKAFMQLPIVWRSFGRGCHGRCCPLIQFGARHAWANQITQLLNSIPGPKIVYSFSMPSSGALAAIAHREAKDIKAFICDGGPFLQLALCTWNLFTFEYEIKSCILRAIACAIAFLMFGPGLARELRALFKHLPANFPVLSIRGLADPLVDPSAITKVFAKQNRLKLTVVNLPQGRHLDGLKNFTTEYRQQVTHFLAGL
jgi:pimeloyl-ACP methyl ester carboxylesterase